VIDALLAKELLAVRARLALSSATRRYADLRSTRNSLAWERFRAALLRSAGVVWSTLTITSQMDRGAPLRVSQRSAVLPPTLPGVERTLESTSLDLKGRCDRIDRNADGTYLIWDYKTTVELDHLGDVGTEVRAQMELYGLLVSERQPDAQIALRVVEFGKQPTNLTLPTNWHTTRRMWLEQIASRAIRNIPLKARTLATPGPHCFGCRIRHRCELYREAAIAAWSRPDLDIPWPNDTWGEVLSVEPKGEGEVSVLLRDDAGRLVRVSGLSSDSLGEPIRNGVRLYLFSLNSLNLSTTATRHHPTNFFELPSHPRQLRAFALMAFLG
jgi:hypothetical protein